MARPKSDDPKTALTIRLRASVLARIGGDARSVVEALIEERFGGARPRPAVEEPSEPRKFVSRLKGQWKAP